MLRAKSFFRMIETVPPIIYTVVAWGITIGFSALISASISDELKANDTIFGLLLLFVFLSVPDLTIISLFYATRHYRVDRYYLFRIIQLYIILALTFANLIYILIFFADPTQIYEGVHGLWVWLGGLQGRRLYWENIWRCAVDCIYFSFATITTSAYGDIKPTIWYTKLLANLEVLSGLGLVSIGLGRYFSENDGI